MESSPVGKNFRILVDEPVLSACSLEGQQFTGLLQKKGDQQGDGDYCLFLLYTCESTSGALCPHLGPTLKEGCKGVGASPEEDHKDYQSAEAPLM